MEASDKKIFFVNVEFPGITGKGHVYNKFDYEIVESMYSKYDDSGFPIVYNFLYKYYLGLPKSNTLITFSPDPSISASTVSGLAEKYMYTHTDSTGVMKFLSTLKIVYVTSYPHMLTEHDEINVKNLSNSVLSNLLCLNSKSFTGHKLALSSSQFILLGLNDNIIDDVEIELLGKMDVQYYTLKQIRKKGVKNIMESINEQIQDSPLMVIYDLASTAYEVAPCVNRFLKDGIRTNLKMLNGFDVNELKDIFTTLNNKNLVGLDIIGYDFRIDTKERALRVTCEAAKIPLLTLVGLKEKKINIFNESSKFLIWRPTEQKSHNDIGWFILNGVPLEMREKLIKEIDSDTITTFPIENDGIEEIVFISSTTIEDQEKKSFYDPELTIYDCVLYPAQKVSMMFELLNVV